MQKITTKDIERINLIEKIKRRSGKVLTIEELEEKSNLSKEELERLDNIKKELEEESNKLLEEYSFEPPKLEELKEDYEKNNSLLSDKEKQIFQLKYGLQDGKEWTNQEIAQYYQITEERVRQIVAKSIRILRRGTRPHSIKDFL